MADAYSTANNVPNVLFEVAAGGAFAGVVVPLLSRCIARKDAESTNRVASALLTWVMAVGVPIALLVVVLADPLADGLLGARDQVVIDTAALLLRIFAVQVPLYGMSVVLSGILQAHHKFVMPALAPMLSSIVVIGAFLMFWQTGGSDSGDPAEVPVAALMWLGWGTTGGVIAFTLPQLIPAPEGREAAAHVPVPGRDGTPGAPHGVRGLWWVACPAGRDRPYHDRCE